MASRSSARSGPARRWRVPRVRASDRTASVTISSGSRTGSGAGQSAQPRQAGHVAPDGSHRPALRAGVGNEGGDVGRRRPGAQPVEQLVGVEPGIEDQAERPGGVEVGAGHDPGFDRGAGAVAAHRRPRSPVAATKTRR
jgi:hypothetical protein